MAQARSARATAPARPAGRARPGSRIRPRVLAGGRTIRWDRVGRFAVVVVLVVLAYMYVGPAASYVEALRESRARSVEVKRMEAEHARLRARRDALRDPRTLEREARRLGMVKPGERAYVVRGLPRD